MGGPTSISWDSHLDVFGRWLLTSLDYREWGLLAVLVFVAFAILRRVRVGSWPDGYGYLQLLRALLEAFGGVTVMVVFLLTKPPAVELLSGTTLLILGLGVPVFLIVGESIPKLKALFFPSEAPKPQEKLSAGPTVAEPKAILEKK